MIFKEKNYKISDFVLIPFKICPLYTSVKIINMAINALIPSVQVVATAMFVDTAVSIFNGVTEYNKIFLPLILLALIVAYEYMNWSLMCFITTNANMRMNEQYRASIVEKRAKLEYSHIENNDTWDLITRTCGDPVGRINSGFSNISGAADIIIRVISLLSLLLVHVWWAALVIIGMCVPLFFLAIKAGKETYKENKEAEKHNRRSWYLSGVLSGRDNVEERTLFGYTADLNKRWYEKFETSRTINIKVNLKYFIKMKGSSILTIVISILIIGVLLFPLSSGSITIGMFMGLVTATLGLVQMMSWQLSWITQQLANSREYLKDLTAFSMLSEKDGALDLPSEKNLIFESAEFRNVTFKYPGTEKYILQGLNFKMTKNLHYAFVGVNGAGKTTITKLLTGMYDNYEGEILLNGIELRKYKLSELKKLFSVVYQDFAKYYIPIKDNILLGNVLKNDEARVKSSAELIELMPTIENLPNKMDTWLGKIKENGVDISGGEWQRVAIARSLYSDAAVSILDEPTAALDPVAESNIYQMFGKISSGKTTIFITHRLGGAKLADEIIVIDDGKVAEQGNHDALMSEGGIYSEMFESQRSWYL